MKKEKRKQEEPKGFAGAVYTLSHDLIYVLTAITVIFVFLMRLTGVHGSSMVPTLRGVQDNGSGQGDYLILLSNVLYSDYQQGDIVVACVPSFDNGKPIVKRVIATQGQTVELVSDTNESGSAVYHVLVDGVQQEESFINNEAMRLDHFAIAGQKMTVPENCYFLMGDNRDNSNDSRNPLIGMVDRQYIVGKAFMIVLPGGENGRDWSRFGILRSYGT